MASLGPARLGQTVGSEVTAGQWPEGESAFHRASGGGGTRSELSARCRTSALAPCSQRPGRDL